MRTFWQTDMGHLACRWSELDQNLAYNPQWMQEARHIQSGYLPPLPDFASHSAFGGADWFRACGELRSERESL